MATFVTKFSRKFITMSDHVSCLQARSRDAVRRAGLSATAEILVFKLGVSALSSWESVLVGERKGMHPVNNPFQLSKKVLFLGTQPRSDSRKVA